jgi:amino acid transporter
MVLIVGLAMAEVCSSYPTAGGLYYWSAKLGGKNGAAWSWFTGWFNLLGQVAVTAGIDGGLALFTSAFLNNWFNYPLDAPHILLVYAVALFLHGLLNTFGVRVVALLNNISVWWHIVGVAVIVGVLFFVPSHHQSVGFIFGHFQNNTGAAFTGSALYVVAVGLLLAQYTFTGYDASAHMTEETRNAAVAGPRGIVMSILVSLIAGWVLLIGVTYAIQDYASAPTNSIWLATVGAFLLWLPYLYNPNAYAAVISIAVIGLYIAYGIPILLRLRVGDRFQRGPWHLGRWSRPIGMIAVVWIGIISILFVLPTVFPVTLANLNYTIVAVAAVGFGTGIWWLLSARHWFHGPKIQGSAEELAAIEAELVIVSAPT